MDKILIAQAVGAVAVVMWTLSFQIKSNTKLFFVQTIANLLFCVQFILLGGYAGCVGLLLCSFRNVLIVRRDKWKWAGSYWWIVVIAVVDGICIYVTWSKPVDLLAWFACVGGSLTYWTNNARTIRLGNLFCAGPSWLIYDISYRAWPSAVSETIAIISVIISIIRFGWKNLGRSEGEFR